MQVDIPWHEYQMTTAGIVSGLKHTRNQVYIVTTATINSGNSGGPAVNEGDVVEINHEIVSRGVEEANMIIPSNRNKRTLPQLMDNSENVNKVHEALVRILFQSPDELEDNVNTTVEESKLPHGTTARLRLHKVVSNGTSTLSDSNEAAFEIQYP